MSYENDINPVYLVWSFIGLMVALFVFGCVMGDPPRDKCRDKGGTYVKTSDGYICIHGLKKD